MLLATAPLLAAMQHRVDMPVINRNWAGCSPYGSITSVTRISRTHLQHCMINFCASRHGYHPSMRTVLFWRRGCSYLFARERTQAGTNDVGRVAFSAVNAPPRQPTTKLASPDADAYGFYRHSSDITIHLLLKPACSVTNFAVLYGRQRQTNILILGGSALGRL